MVSGVVYTQAVGCKGVLPPHTFAQPKSDVTILMSRHVENRGLRNADTRKMASKEVSVKSDILTGRFIAITARYCTSVRI